MSYTKPQDAQTSQLVREKIRKGWASLRRLAAGSTLILAAGLAWLGVQTIQNAHLQSNGIHASARVDQVSSGRGATIIVSYAASPVYVGIPLWLGGTGTNYKVGERVEISYDRHDPTYAVLATGLPAPGGMNGLGFLIVIAGLLGLGITAYVARLYQRAGPVVDLVPRKMSASAESDTRGSVAIVLEDQGMAIARLRYAGRKGWDLNGPPQPVLVFGSPTIKAVVAVVDEGNQTVAIGKLRRPKKKRARTTEPGGSGAAL